MNATTGRAARPPDGSARTPGEQATWTVMHQANIQAWEAGRADRAAGVPADLNPYPPAGGNNTGDQRYWWNEGRQGRPFQPLTDIKAIRTFAHDHRPRTTDAPVS